MALVRRHWIFAGGLVATIAILVAAFAGNAVAGGGSPGLGAGVDWSFGDMAVVGIGLPLWAAGLDRAWTSGRPRAARVGSMLATTTAVLLLVATFAVGVVRSESHPANLLGLPVVALGLAGAIAASRRPGVAAGLLLAAAVCQAAMPFVAAAIWSFSFDAGLAKSIAASGAVAAAFAAAAALVRPRSAAFAGTGDPVA